MPSPNVTALRAVAERLDGLGLNYAFVGGAIVNLLLDDPGFAPARATDDVDVIIEVVTARRYSDVEEKIRALGLSHDMREGAPRCRWMLGNVTVGIMPTEDANLGLNTAWFKEALATASEREFGHTRLRLVSPVGFLVTKHVAFLDRGDGDFYASHDLEDFVTVIDGREGIVAEVDGATAGLRSYLIGAVRNLMATRAFDEALPGQLPSDEGSQRRLPGLRRKLRAIAALDL
jgi:predicted nucleotidyltransferase